MIAFVKKNPLFVAILLISAFFRLFRISSYMEFLGDQGRDLVIVRDFLKNGNLFFIGPQTSIGNMYLGPYYYYLIAPALLLANFNPVGPAIFVALLSVLTTALIYFVAKKWFDTKSALVASLLFAISPVVIKYSSFSWNPNIMPIFSLLFVYFLVQAVFFKKYKHLIYASLSFIMILNSHYLGLLLLPLAAIYWFFHWLSLKKDPKNKKKFLRYTL
ncbi:glycosyltransferase family 39 protein, partial [Patescibacteria group bacterium]|nr:glycosyltransferase family 39 protein [Patescibacteria group bacterium]